jgi:micrococcal nuclease
MNISYIRRSNLRRAIYLVVCLLISFLAIGCAISQDDANTVRVIRVVDGDTVEVNIQGTKEKVRLIGVDTPETVHPTIGEEPYGIEASDFTKEKLTDQTVELEFDVEERDRYGRLLAYVWLDGEMFNEVLLSDGYAQIATYPPNVRYVERFQTAQQEAREAERGLWGVIDEEPVTAQKERLESSNWLGNANTKKFHYPDCQHGQKTKSYNQVWFDSRQEAIDAGYEPCGSCKP